MVFLFIALLYLQQVLSSVFCIEVFEELTPLNQVLSIYMFLQDYEQQRCDAYIIVSVLFDHFANI